MPLRLLDRFKEPIERTPVDNLESLTWILVWVGLGVMNSDKDSLATRNPETFSASIIERGWTAAVFHRHTFIGIQGAKHSILSYFTSSPSRRELSPLQVEPLVEDLILKRMVVS